MPIKSTFVFGFVLFFTVFNSPLLKADTGLQHWLEQQKAHDERLKQQDLSKRPVFKQRVVQVNTAPLQLAQNPSNTTPNPTPVRLGTQTSLNINTASAEEIVAKLDGIGLKKAQAIVAYRQQHGEFQQIDDLKNVKGIGEKAIARNRAYLRLND